MIKKYALKFLSLMLCPLLLGTGVYAAGDGTGAAVYSNSTALSDGLTYTNALSINAAGDSVETYTLESSAGSSVYPIVLACDTIYGGMTVPQIIAYAKSLGYNAVGAVNSDFGYWSTRIPCGMVVEDGVYKSSPEGNNALAFSDQGAFVSFMPEVNITLSDDTNGNSVALTHYNKTRAEDGGLYLYSEYFSTVSTRTSTDGWFVRFKVLDGQMSLNGTMTLEVTELIHGEYDALTIGEDNLILTAADASDLLSDYEKFSVGDRVTLTTTCSDDALAGANWVSGCGNLLVSDYEPFHSEWWDKSVTGTHPRTAVGIRADGSVVYYVMDGRSENSGGATLTQLAQDMISMGCKYAVNMDGGGSSVLSLLMPGASGCAVLNNPSDGYLRAVCTYIVFVTDAAPSGRAENLYIGQDGAFVLCDSSLTLTCLATDNTLKTVSAPADMRITAALGRVSGGVYTAGGTAGVDTLSLSSASSGASGTGSIHIISAADSLTVADAGTGTAVSDVTLDQGDTLALSVSAAYLNRPVAMDASAVRYTVEGDIGTITEDGVFTASGTPGAEGKITVTAAGVTAEVAVKLAFEFPDMQGHWASAYVKMLYEAGVVNGTTATTFSPDTAMKRCDFILMLYRAAGEPAVSAACSFGDVPSDAYYAKAVAWAEANGIAKGSGSGTFDPSGTLTREQGFAFLYRALSALGDSAPDGGTVQLAGFSDASLLSDWAETPAATLVSLGIVQGSGGKIDPSGTLTRAQMAKMFCVELYGDE
jgi:hypothetical protein